MSRSKVLHDFFRDEYGKWKGDVCEICGLTHRYDEDGYLVTRAHLTVHHIDGNVRNNDPVNLSTLCRPCHDKVEAGELELAEV